MVKEYIPESPVIRVTPVRSDPVKRQERVLSSTTKLNRSSEEELSRSKSLRRGLLWSFYFILFIDDPSLDYHS